ncbi:type II toxin-antitoxin system RelE/ParE family toxin [bacterium]|nr:type II toxin-antitoxin system RelE/ParE family toxin [bacterium]
MLQIRKTELFSKWLESIRDIQNKGRILARIERLACGNPGDVKPVGNRISELRIHYGPGYRVYYKKIEQEIIILLAGGNKNTQINDIKTAKNLADNL